MPRPYLLAAALLLPTAGHCQEVLEAGSLTEVFATACLAAAPDFSRSAELFHAHGFSVSAFDGGLHEAVLDATNVVATFTVYDDPQIDGAYCSVMSDEVLQPAVVPHVADAIARIWAIDPAAHAAEWPESEGWVFGAHGRQVEIIVSGDLHEAGVTMTVTIWR